MSLYLWLNILSISIPFVVSFSPRLKLYKDWNSLFLATFLAMTPYIVWDVFFTANGFWGFNETYLMGIYLLGLPIEEWLFFICIPYACVFTHYALLELNNKLVLSKKMTKNISIFLMVFFALVMFLNLDKAYTSIDMLAAIIIMAIVIKFNFKLLQSYYITFLAMLVPFVVVNGILTGTGIENEIVWYNNSENLALRFFTIPVEDFVYAFSLLLLNLFLFELFKNYFSKSALVKE